MSESTTKKKPPASPIGRFSFVHLAKPNDFSSKYEVTLLFDGGTDLSALKKMAAEQVAEARKKYGKHVKLHNPFRDAAEKDHLDGYESGMTFISFRSANKPVLIDARKQPIDPDDPDGVYSGCYGRVTFSCFHWQAKNDKGAAINWGVSFGLIAVQKAKDGERFGFASTDEGLDELEVPNDGAEEVSDFDTEELFS